MEEKRSNLALLTGCWQTLSITIKTRSIRLDHHSKPPPLNSSRLTVALLSQSFVCMLHFQTHKKCTEWCATVVSPENDFSPESSCGQNYILQEERWRHQLMDVVISLWQLTAQQIAIQQQLLQVQQQHLLNLQRQGLLSVLPTSPITAPGQQQ